MPDDRIALTGGGVPGQRLSGRLGYAAILLPFALYCAVALFWLGHIQRYEFVSGNLISNANFEQQLNHWQLENNNALVNASSGIELSALDGSGRVGLSQTLDTRHTLFLFRATLRASGDQSAMKPIAGIYLHRAPSNESRGLTFPLSRFKEAHDWFEGESFVQIPSGSMPLSLSIHTFGDGYQIAVRDMALIALEVTPQFKWLSRVLYGLLVLFAVIAAYLVLLKLWHNLDRLLFWLLCVGATALMFAVLYFATTTRDLAAFIHQLGLALPQGARLQIEPLVKFILQEPMVFATSIGAKLLHFGFFFIAGTVAAACVVFARAWFLFLVLVVLTIGTETLQSFEVSRRGSFYDVGLNSSGLLAGFLMCLLVLVVVRHIGARWRT